MYPIVEFKENRYKISSLCHSSYVIRDTEVKIAVSGLLYLVYLYHARESQYRNLFNSIRVNFRISSLKNQIASLWGVGLTSRDPESSPLLFCLESRVLKVPEFETCWFKKWQYILHFIFQIKWYWLRAPKTTDWYFFESRYNRLSELFEINENFTNFLTCT